MFYNHFYFVVDFEIHSKGLSGGAIGGIVAASCVFVIMVLVALRKMGFLGGRDITNKGKFQVHNKPVTCRCRSCNLHFVLKEGSGLAVKLDEYASIIYNMVINMFFVSTYISFKISNLL